jgi:hypothetical protein
MANLSLVHLVIGVLLAEAALLAAWHRPAWHDLAPHLAAGLALALALRSGLAGEGTVAFWLGAAGLAHGAAVWRVLKRRSQ